MTFKDWTEYYQHNSDHFSDINWNTDDRISKDEKVIIFKSIQIFQRGESSEGKNLMRYAKSLNDPEYRNTIRLFIREEQRHSMALGRFMLLNGIPKIKGHWIDEAFRKLRKLTSLENSIIVLLTAEIISDVYYTALFHATSSSLLKDICHQILLDEEMHINFQAFTLQKFYKNRSPFRKRLFNIYRDILIRGTIFVVWYSQTSVLRAGGFTFHEFKNMVMHTFHKSKQMIQGSLPIKIRESKYTKRTAGIESEYIFELTK